MSTWTSIPGFSAYQASSEGKIRNIKTGKESAANVGSHGYLMVNMKADDGKWCARLLHAVVASAFHGERPAGMDCCHNDGNRSNNSAKNLRWDTRKANITDQKTHGTFAWHGTKKLNANHLSEIQQRAEGGESFTQLADAFGVSRSAISAVLRGRSWASVTGNGSAEVSRGQFHRGEKMRGILNNEKVLQIKMMLDTGMPHKTIAATFGVRPQTISNINIGLTWGWLTGRKKAA